MGLLKLILSVFNESAESATASPRTSRGDGVRCTQAFWEERGWQVRGKELRGYYRTRFGAFEGRIEKPFSRPRFYICNPPQAVLKGPHGPCFIQQDKRQFWIHLDRVTDVSTGIMRVEHTLHVALARK